MTAVYQSLLHGGSAVCHLYIMDSTYMRRGSTQQKSHFRQAIVQAKLNLWEGLHRDQHKRIKLRFLRYLQFHSLRKRRYLHTLSHTFQITNSMHHVYAAPASWFVYPISVPEFIARPKLRIGLYTDRKSVV